MQLQPVLNMMAAGGPLLGGALPTLFYWKPGNAEAVPGISTATRSDTALVKTTTDGTFWYQQADVNEVRLNFARREKNLAPTGDLSDWTATGGAVILGDNLQFPGSSNGERAELTIAESEFSSDFFGLLLTVQATAGAGDISLEELSGQFTSTDITVTSTPQTYFIRGGPITAGTVFIRIRNNASGGPIAINFDVTNIMVASAQNNTTAPPFDFTRGDTDPLNIGSNGVGYFATSNGNTEIGGIVTLGAGTPLSDIEYLPETTATNLALHRRDFTDPVWIATNITPVQDAIGIDGKVAASTLTSTAANGTILQTITSASSAHSFAVFVARKTGTGTIEMTIDGATTWVDITSGLSSDITNRFRVTQTLANPSIGFRIATSGDEIEVDVAQLEATAFSTSPMIGTPASTVTRAADFFLTGINQPATGYTAFVDATGPEITNGQDCTAIGGGFAELIIRSRSDGDPSSVVSGLNMAIDSNNWLGNRKKVSLSNPNDGSSDAILSATGETSSTQATSSTSVNEIRIGSYTTTTSQWLGGIHEVVIYDIVVSQSTNEGLVA